jgi:hypothetical protein
MLPVQKKLTRLEIAGWLLYAVSWMTPSLDGSRFGAQAFVDAVRLGTQLTFRSGPPAAIVVGVCLLVGWLANVSILFRLPVWARLFWIAAPWVPFVALLAERPYTPSSVPMLYFYPWAIGIGLIHAARIAAATRLSGGLV